MPELTIEQTRLLSQVRDAKAARMSVKATVEAENRQRLEDATRDADALLARLVRQAHEAGVSKRRIGREGLGTVDPTIVNRTLEKTEGEARVAAAIGAAAAVPNMRELTHEQAAERGFDDPDADLFVELHYVDFPTKWPAKGDPYPNPLEGVVKRVFGLWSAVRDESAFVDYELGGEVLVPILNAYAKTAGR
jgi:hypothetical protein